MQKKVNEAELREIYQTRLKDRKRYQSSKKYKRSISTPERLGSLVEDVFADNPVAQKRLGETKALMAWDEIVGPAGAQNSQALMVRNQELLVYVRDPLWMQQLLLLKREILQRYLKMFPELRLRDIYFTRTRNRLPEKSS